MRVSAYELSLLADGELRKENAGGAAVVSDHKRGWRIALGAREGRAARERVLKQIEMVERRLRRHYELAEQ